MKTIKNNVNNLIAIAHIVYECNEKSFNQFIKDLNNLTTSYYGTIDGCIKLIGSINKERKIIPYRIRKFNKEHRAIINIIKMYSNISIFIPDKYEMNEVYNQITLAYNYIKEHENEINNILELLEQMKKLNIVEVILDKNLKFDYDFVDDSSSIPNYDFKYFEKVDDVTSYDSKKGIKCSVKSSNYYLTQFSYKKYIITLNSLILNSNILPKKINFEKRYNEIIELSKTLKEKQNKTKMNFNNEIENMYKAINSANDSLLNIYKFMQNENQGLQNKDLSNEQIKDSALKLLNSMKRDLIKFDEIHKHYCSFKKIKKANNASIYKRQ